MCAMLSTMPNKQPTGLSARQHAWDRYWAEDTLHSCPGSFRGNYDGAIAAFWHPVFGQVPRQGRVLDLGTGNGPLAELMLQSIGPDRLPEVHGVDLATPQPKWLDRLDATLRQRLHFHPNVSMEHLPFEDAHFDVIVSQYGFEYADRPQATAELLRVAAPVATIAMICHHHGSRLVEVADHEVQHLAWLLDETEIFPSALAMLPYVAMSATAEGRERLKHDPEANAVRARFNVTMNALAERAHNASIPDALHDMLAFFPQLMQWTAAHGEQAGRELLLATQDNMRNAALRSQELRAFALQDDDMATLRATLEQAEFTTEVRLVREGEYLMGWGLLAQRKPIS